MNWPYIAGFFDGEGHVSNLMGNRRTPFVELAQSKHRGLILLQEIQQFLQEYNITTSGAALRMSRAGSLGKQPMYRIRVTTDAKKFLNFVMPYLRIKRTEAQDVLRFHKMYPPIYGHPRVYREGDGKR